MIWKRGTGVSVLMVESQQQLVGGNPIKGKLVGLCTDSLKRGANNTRGEGAETKIECL